MLLKATYLPTTHWTGTWKSLCGSTRSDTSFPSKTCFEQCRKKHTVGVKNNWANSSWRVPSQNHCFRLSADSGRCHVHCSRIYLTNNERKEEQRAVERQHLSLHACSLSKVTHIWCCWEQLVYSHNLCKMLISDGTTLKKMFRRINRIKRHFTFWRSVSKPICKCFSNRKKICICCEYYWGWIIQPAALSSMRKKWVLKMFLAKLYYI